MSNGSTKFPLWNLNIEPSSFPLAGDCQVAQIPSNNVPGPGWFFVFAVLGTPNDNQFTTQIGPESYTFNVEHRDKHKASGTVTSSASGNGTWSAQGIATSDDL
jgi:hypothetical protein